MRWSLKLGRVAGIAIYVHITFLALVAFIFSVYFQKGGGALAIQGTALFLAVFGCVLLHELGHALMAKRFGVKAREIVLLPIGGVARLDRMPTNPREELLITVAGPAVNVAIAAGLYGLLLALEALPARLADVTDVASPRTGVQTFLVQLLAINVFMAVFNLIPAFPMDGGRIFRSALAFSMDHARATRIAAAVGQGFAVLFGLYGILSSNLILFLIAVFVFVGASGESMQAQIQAVFRGLPAEVGMVRNFRALSGSDSLSRAVEELLAGSQMDFPVFDGDRLLGILTRQRLVASLREMGADARIADIPLVPVESVDAADPLFHAWEELARQGTCCLPVRRKGETIGWLTRENIAEVAMVEEALSRHARDRTG
ncbi:MAG: site-2 protease family protein [Planctomycetota bacterium]